MLSVGANDGREKKNPAGSCHDPKVPCQKLRVQHISPTYGQSEAQGLAVPQGSLAGYDVDVALLSSLGYLQKLAIHIDGHPTRLAVCSCPLLGCVNLCIFATDITCHFSPTHTARHTIFLMAARSPDTHRGTSQRGVLLRKI